MSTRFRLAKGDQVVVLTGAGVSAESGVATFRGTGGLWEGHSLEQVATPQGFAADPQLVWRFYSARRKARRTVEPNPGHRALVALEQAVGEDRFCLITQNVDGLHTAAGSRHVLEMHGALRRTRCSAANCPLEPFEEDLLHEDEVPMCPRCGSPLRPDIVWFGESVLHDAAIHKALLKCRLFIAAGTSGTVYPANQLGSRAKARGAATILVNLEPIDPPGVDPDSEFDEFHQGRSGEILPGLVDQLISNLGPKES